jgi:hypothetical protein
VVRKKSPEKFSSKSLTEPKSESQPDSLKGWGEISSFLSQPVSVAQRWAHSSGMPIERKGRRIYASREKLNHWLEHESSGEPVQVASNRTDLGSELRRALSYMRQHNRGAQ